MEHSVSPKEEVFGTYRGVEVKKITLNNASGMSVSVLNLGATLQSVIVPDEDGNPVDVCLGYDTPEAYLTNRGHLGGTIGRWAGRIRNASFLLDGRRYELSKNNGEHQLHGGFNGFDRKIWKHTLFPEENSVCFVCKSADGEEGFPGEVTVALAYKLTDDNRLILEYRAETTKPTLLNLTNHWYFNLNGQGCESVDDHVLQIAADRYVILDEDCNDTGITASVEGTPVDFREAKPIGRDWADLCAGPLGGYDHVYCLGEPGVLRDVARVSGPLTGIQLAVRSDMDCVVLYTGNSLGGRKGKGGTLYPDRSGFCLENEHCPGAAEHECYPSAVLRPGECYTQHTELVFE